MDEEIKNPHNVNSNELKIDFSRQDTENELIKLNKRVQLFKTRRFQIILIGILIAIVAFLILIAPNFVGYRFGFYPFSMTVTFVVIILLGISVAFFAAIIFQSIITSLESTLEELKARQRVANQLDEERPFRIYVDGGAVNLVPSLESSLNSSSTSSSYFNKLVQINVENLAAYYTQVKAQTNKSFTASLVAGAAGFILISVGLILGFTSTANSQILVYISSGSGIVTEFIAAIFFYLYNRTVRQMKGYHDSLLNVQNILLSLKLVEDTKEEDAKIKMIGQMLEYLVGKKIFTPLSTEPEKE